jgi:hypothetical protein
VNVEVLWFEGCPGHEAAIAMLNEAIAVTGSGATVSEVLVPDEATARRERFPGSPTIRVNGRDIQPGYEDDGNYGLRCRMYQTAAGYRGVPERDWIIRALQAEPAPASD